MTTRYDALLVNLYRERGMVSLADPPSGENLRTRCERASACWKDLGAEAVPAKGTAAAELSPPLRADRLAADVQRALDTHLGHQRPHALVTFLGDLRHPGGLPSISSGTSATLTDLVDGSRQLAASALRSRSGPLGGRRQGAAPSPGFHPLDDTALSRYPHCGKRCLSPGTGGC